MAGVVKWLRPRIVVPLCVGSNPTTRPIKKVLAFAKTFFIWVCEGENALFVGSAQAEPRLKPSAKSSSGRLDKWADAEAV